MILSSASALGQITADRLLEDIRFGATLQDADLQGQVRKGSKKLPVSLFMRGEDIQFYFKDSRGKDNRFHVRLEQDDLTLLEMQGKKERHFPREKLGQSIDGTDLTYEDLSLRFLYWKGGVIEGPEKVNGYECYRIRLVNPTNKGRYGIVYVWAHKKYHALIQVKGYTKGGAPLKEFLITDLMKVKDTYTVKQMRIDTIDPKTARSVGRTYLEFQKPTNLRKRGPR